MLSRIGIILQTVLGILRIQGEGVKSVIFVSRLKKNERDLLKVLDVLLEVTERRKSLRRGGFGTTA